MKKLFFIIILVLFSVVPSYSQEMPVPIDIQYELFLKIMTFDRNLEKRVGNEIVIGIIYQSRFRKSLNVKDEFIKVINNSEVKKINNIKVKYLLIDLDKNDILSVIENQKVNIIYISPLRAVNINKISEISKKNQILTLTGVPEYCALGISVGIGQHGDKPLVIINISSAKDENADFSSQLLKLVKIINKE